MSEPTRQIADLVAALRDVEGALGEANVQIARREERGEALSARVSEMQAALRAATEDLRESSRLQTGQAHALELLDLAVKHLQEDVTRLTRTLAEHPYPCPAALLVEEFQELTVTVNRLDVGLDRVVGVLGFDDSDAKTPGLVASVKNNKSTLRTVGAIAGAVVAVAGLLLVLAKTLQILNGYLNP